MNQTQKLEEEITLLKKQLSDAQSKIQDQQLILDTVLESSLAGYWDWYIKDEYEYMSPTLKSMFGYKDDEMPNHPDEWQKIIYQEDLPGVFDCFSKHIESKGQVPFDNEVRYHHKDGSTVDVLCRGKVMEWDEEGNPVRMIGAHVDISSQKQAERLAKDKESLLETAGEMSQVGAWEFDLVHQILTWSKEVHHIHETDLSYVPNVEEGINFYHPDDVPVIQQVVEECITQGKPYDVKLRIITAKGNEKNVRALGKAKWEGDQVVKMYGAFQDITEIEQLKESRERFFEVTLDLFCVANLEGYFLELSPAWTETLGWSEEELKSKPFLEFVHPTDQPPTLAALETLSEGKNILQFENRYLCKDGTYRWLSWKSYVDTEKREVFAVARDIQETKDLEGEVLRQKNLLETIVNSMGEAVVAADKDWNFIIFNNAAKQLHGIGKESNNESDWGKAYQMFMPDGKTPFPHDELPLVRAMGGEHVDYSEMIIRHSETHQEYHVTVTGRPVLSDGQLIGSVVVFRDMSVLKRREMELREAMEQAQSASRAKSEFLASMSHEIRTPLNAVIGMSELLSSTHLTSEQQQYVSSISHGGDALLSLINDILDFSKIEAQQIEIEMIDFDFGELIENHLDVLSLKAHQKGLEVSYHFAPEVPVNLVGDPTRIRQVLYNLIGNAIKFTHQGSISVFISLEKPIVKDLCSICIEIADTGIGMSEQEQKTIFERFTQADTSTTRRYGGTGLGLAITSQVVELMGGTISVASVQKKGSTFKVILPFKVNSEPQSYIPETPLDVTGKRALVVDDIEENRLILKEILESWGMDVTLRTSGGAGQDELYCAYREGKPYDLMLLDVRMPLMDGFEVAERIQAVPELAKTVTMMLTSDNRREDIQRSRDLGVRGYLVKPVKRKALINAIQQAFLKDPKFEVPKEKDQQSSQHQNASLKVLLAEDAEENQVVFAKFLQQWGADVHLAENGQQAVDAFQQQLFDLVLMDIQMPVMDGFTAVRKIREYEKKQGTSPVSIIALTAMSLQDDFKKCLNAGCDDVITKPLRRKTLIGKIEERLHAQHSSDTTTPSESASLPSSSQKASVEKSYMVNVSKDYEEDWADLIRIKRKHIQTAKEALSEKDLCKLQKIGHTMKGEASIEQIGALGKTLEQAAKEESFEQAEQIVNELDEFLDKMVVHFE